MLKSTGTNLQYSITRFLANWAIFSISSGQRPLGPTESPKKKNGPSLLFLQISPITNAWVLASYPKPKPRRIKLKPTPKTQPK